MIEGMGCPGGCVAGVGTIIPPERAKFAVDQIVKTSEQPLPAKEMEDLADKLTKNELMKGKSPAPCGAGLKN